MVAGTGLYQVLSHFPPRDKQKKALETLSKHLHTLQLARVPALLCRRLSSEVCQMLKRLDTNT